MPTRVYVMKRSGRQFFEVQWKDPLTFRKRTVSTKTNRRRDAERFAARIESQINEGTYDSSKPIEWQAFRQRYETEALAPLGAKTQAKTKSTLNAIEKFLGKPKYLVSLDAATIARFQTLLRDNGREEFTIKSHAAEIRKMMRWAFRMKLIPLLPAIEIPKRVHGMKGRAITLEEFERMLTATASVVGELQAASWKSLLRGLWLSGLRLGEAMHLSWNDDRHLCVDLSGRRPMFRIRAHAEKGRKDRVLPITPDFAEFLEAIPQASRRGLVFKLIPPWAASVCPMRQDTTSKLICKIGKKAGVKVWSGRNKKADEEEKIKYASAHDLRRSFGFRWSQKVPAATLMLLMRHESIHTTMEFYVGRDADAAADTVWAASSNIPANTAVHEPVTASRDE